ncbi:hypothetical protein [Natronospira bacteriovora]|uniref:Glycosyl transferase family 28 C-terminal domain-containing protein n=1 Tax=Natronospira bacteriovora TaxID=3069753 RepID=A0ABU0W843_9GAMM|nr:hypothetical protein [Natronospira sp. AB-CW4]MDQ2070127.1 hypothetical protein [Natronospira sp. AB-CW4]
MVSDEQRDMNRKGAAGPTVLFFNINGSGLGHMNRCLAYARRMKDRARPVFFSLSSAMEMIHDMGFEGDYFVSPFWSLAESNAWNQELAFRFGLMLEQVQPDTVVFDGTWPFQGFLTACRAHGVRRMVWSNRGLHKADMEPVPVDEGLFDLVIEPGELGDGFAELNHSGAGRKVRVPPVTLLDDEELLDRESARKHLELEPEKRYALFSLGPGNLKDVSDIGLGLIDTFLDKGIQPVWARAPISIRDIALPEGVMSVSLYPLLRYLHAFDYLVAAAGYNSSCEVVQSGVPALLVPNRELVDDQARRAHMVAAHSRAVVSDCETPDQRRAAVDDLLALSETPASPRKLSMDGAGMAAREILALTGEGKEP